MRTNLPARGIPLCGCYYAFQTGSGSPQKVYLPLVELDSHTTILATTSRTKLRQIFTNTSDQQREIQYTFPLYDGVSVVEFKCTVKDKVLVGLVKEKQQARADYQAAVEQGKAAGLLEQLAEAGDVFTTKIGNVPAGEKIVVEIVYLGELKHDAETDGARFQIPLTIAPRYGSVSEDSAKKLNDSHADDSAGIKILVDVILDEGSVVHGLQSPSHPTAITMGRTSTMPEDAFNNHHASASLALDSTVLDKDFVIVVLSKETSSPRAILEHHTDIADQRALMATLVPKFKLPDHHPEIIFVVDRSGSMRRNIRLLVSALKVFLKSLPVGAKFNICSFGTNHSFLFDQSKTYDQSSLDEAMNHVSGFAADYGGTNMYPALEATFSQRHPDMPLEVMVLTDGQINNQDAVFELVRKSSKEIARLFSLGIGSGASSSLVEGVARAGNGFAQFVNEGERMDKRLIRMLKAALVPHTNDYKLEVKYGKDDTDLVDDFEIIESFEQSIKIKEVTSTQPPPYKPTISLFDTSADMDAQPDTPKGRYDSLPAVSVPKVLQAPHSIPPLYPFSRSTVYLLLGPGSCQRSPVSVVLKATSEHGPLELGIPVQDIGHGKTIHQLAAKKAVQELEQRHGWIIEVDDDSVLLKDKYPGGWDLIVEREAVRLGTQFQVGGKWCSFVAVEEGQDADAAEHSTQATDHPNRPVELKRKGIRRQLMSPPSQNQHMARKVAAPTSPADTIMWSGSQDTDATAQTQNYIPPQTRGASAVFSPAHTLPRPTASAFGQASAPVLYAPMAAASPLQVDARFSPGRSGHDNNPSAYVLADEDSTVEATDSSMHHSTSQPPPPPPSQAGPRVKFCRRPARDASAFRRSAPSDTNTVMQDDKPSTPTEIMHKLIDLQNFDGSWSDYTAVAQLLNLSSIFTPAEITISVVKWLRTEMKEEEDVWEMVVEKAVGWLRGLGIDDGAV